MRGAEHADMRTACSGASRCRLHSADASERQGARLGELQRIRARETVQTP